MPWARFQIETKSETSRLEIAFALRRGVILDVHCDPASKCETNYPPDDPRFSRAIAVDWDEPLRAGTPITLHVRYAGAPLWMIEYQCPGERGGAGPEAAMSFLSWEHVLQRRDELARSGAPSLRADRQFFNQIDRELRTDIPVELQLGPAGKDERRSAAPATRGAVERRRAAAEALLGYLLGGHDVRLLNGGKESPYIDRLSAPVALLEPISEVFVRACEQCFDGDRERLTLAFYRFVNGDLILLSAGQFAQAERASMHTVGTPDGILVTACQPDSWYYFLFAELADLCIARDVDRGFWYELLPTLIHTQFLLMRRKHHRNGPTVRASIGPMRPDPHRNPDAAAGHREAFRSRMPTAEPARSQWLNERWSATLGRLEKEPLGPQSSAFLTASDGR